MSAKGGRDLRVPFTIFIGPDHGRSLQCTITEDWKTILSRTIRCGKTHTISVTRRQGISREDKAKLDGIVESKIGISAIGQLKAKIQASLSTTVKFEEMVEQTESYETTAGECDELQLLLAQKIRTYAIKYEDTRLFHRKYHTFDIVEYIDEIWDRGQVLRNHPDCSCPGEKPEPRYLIDLLVGPKITNTECVFAERDYYLLPKLGVSFTGDLEVGMTFVIPASQMPPYWSFMTDVLQGDNIDCKISDIRALDNELVIPDFADIIVDRFDQLDDKSDFITAEPAPEEREAPLAQE